MRTSARRSYHKRPDHEELSASSPAGPARPSASRRSSSGSSSRAIFRPSIHNELFNALCHHDSTLNAAKQLLDTDDLKILQSMCLIKPPNSGEKHWHQVGTRSGGRRRAGWRVGAG